MGSWQRCDKAHAIGCGAKGSGPLWYRRRLRITDGRTRGYLVLKRSTCGIWFLSLWPRNRTSRHRSAQGVHTGRTEQAAGVWSVTRASHCLRVCTKASACVACARGVTCTLHVRRTSRRADLSERRAPAGPGPGATTEATFGVGAASRVRFKAYPRPYRSTTCLIREKKLTGSGTAGRAHEQNVLACRDLGPRTGDLALKETRDSVAENAV